MLFIGAKSDVLDIIMLGNTRMDEEYKKRVATAQKIHEKARYLRGSFLNSVAVIERDIAVILTEYFCTEDEFKRDLFFNKVAGKFSLNQKKDILIDIVKSDYPRYWEEHKQFLIDLQSIQEFRNKLAHSVVDFSDEALCRPIEKGVGFVQWKKGAPITDKEFEEWEVKANMIYTVLIEIKRLLPFKEKPIA
jgi:hypothetical protein